MANYNRNYSGSEFDSLVEKYNEMAEIRSLVENLTGEFQHDKILTALNKLIEMGDKMRCPPHLYLNMTPSKQQTVRDTWASRCKELKNSCPREESFEHLLNAMSECATIEEVLQFLPERKKLGLTAQVEINSTRRKFNSQ